MDLVKKFPAGKPVDVYVTHVHDDTANFFVQINDEEAGKLDELMENIDQFITSGQSEPLSVENIEVGVVYLAQYPIDAKWYRARVISVKPSGVCDVHFIDYGNVEQIPAKFVRRIQSSFLQLPPQAYECELTGITKFRGPSFKSAISTLKELILEQELVCVVSSVTGGKLLSNLFIDASCTSSIIDGLLSRVQRIPQAAPITDVTASQPERKYAIVPLEKGSFVDFHVSHVQDPYNFSCQEIKEGTNILNLLDELAEEYSDNDVPLLSSSPGYPCCAKFYDDECWYRGVITNASSVASGTLDVMFVDYGNSQTTAVKDVKGLKDKYLDVPAYAIQCSLYGLQPEGQSTEWSVQAKELFSKIASDKHLIAEICDQGPDGKYHVKLTDMTGEMDMQLDHILIAAKYAEKVGANTQLPSQVNKQQEQESKPISQPSKVAFPFSKEMISPGKEEKVLISTVHSPSEFYCMLYRTSSKLEKLMMDIGRYYSRLSRDDEWLSNPTVGDPCCARFSEDKSWYRAIVTEVHQSGKVKVQFVDYGNYDTVVPKDVKKLAPQFSDLPCQGIKCTMHRICSNGQDWKHGDIKKFEDLALEYSGKLTVISENADGVKNVELLISHRNKEMNVAEAMLLNGNARLKEGACTQSENLASVSSKKFPSLKVPLGTYEDIFVTHIDDPANFWCQLVKHKDDLDAVMNAVDEYCASSNPLRSPSLGLVCCAQYSDEAWYRATISGIKKNNQVEVHFVDYGNHDTVPLSKLRSIKPDCMSLPAQAFKCCLEQVDSKSPFTQEVVDKFVELTVDKELVGMVTSYDESAQQYLIACTDASDGKTLDIYDQMASLLPQSSIKECVIPKQDLKPGQHEHVCVTTVTGLSKFYCQIMRNASEFDIMMGNMDEHYKKPTSTQDEMAGLQPGDYCVAKYSEDDSWYRAKIIDTKVTVHFVDFGNGEVLPATSIKRLVPLFSQLAEQCVECSLSGDIEGLSDSQFVELTLDQEFDMEIVSLHTNGNVKVNLYSRQNKQPVLQLLTREKANTAVNVQQCTITPGSKETVYVTFAENVSKFYIQTSKSGDSLAELMNKMHEHYSSLSVTQESLVNPQVGMYCIANFTEDDGWYRAKVNAVHSDSIEVFYIDYGNSEVLPLARIKTLKTAFCDLPSQAVPCTLSGVSGDNSKSSSKFLQLVGDPEMAFEIEVIGVQAGSLHEVILTNKDTGMSVNQEFTNTTVVTDSKVIQEMPAKLSSISLNVGEKYDGQCGAATSPSHFWFSLNKYVDDLYNLLDLLAQYYPTLGLSEGALSSPSVGTYCCCQYSEDLSWYRAKITAITGTKVEVCFVDFGNSETVELSTLKVLIKEHQNLPEQAIQCRLNQADPANGIEWSEEAKKAFTDIVIEKDTAIKVIQKLSDNCYLVDLLDVNGKDFAVDLLRSKGFAADSIAQVSVPDFKPFPTNFSKGSYIDISPLYCLTPQDFYCHVLTETNIVVFTQMANQLQTLYSTMGTSENTISNPTKGMPCCVLYSADNTWNRGKIVQVINGNTAKVKFVDFGNEEIVPVNQIKVLLPEFLSPPVHSVQCSLSSVKPANNQWSEAAINKFLELVDQKYLVGQVVSTESDKLLLELFDTQDDKVDLNVAQILVEERLAVSTAQQLEVSSPKLSKLSQMQVTSGSTVYITAVDSPDSIYCQISGTEERLDNLMDNLKDFYESGQQTALQSISPNDLCAALFSEDGAWYRAVVEEVSLQEISVRFIDYGNTDTASPGNIKPLDNRFLTEEILALECKLSGVKTVSPDGEWPTEAADFLLTAGGDNGFILKVTSTSDGLEVALSDSNGDLSKRLIDNGLAVSSSLEPTVTHAAPVETHPSVHVSYQSPRINTGQTLEVYITDVTSPGQFYCQLADYGDSLDEMMNAICDHYSNQGAPLSTKPSVGQPCVAVFSEDDMWYRAKIESLSTPDANVRFVDYGNTQKVNVSDLKQIEAQYLTLPVLAVECTIDPQRNTWTSDDTEQFKTAIGEEKVSAEVLKEEDGKYVVRISIGGKCVTDDLLQSPVFSASKSQLDIPFQTIQPNQSESVYVVFAKSSSEICVQLSSYSDQLDQLMATIEHEVQSNPITIKDDKALPGFVCCAYFEDGWYRAVTTSQPTNGQVEVEYVDYGNTAIVPVSDLRAIPESCVALPRQAIHCILEGTGLDNVSKDTLENTLMDSLLAAVFLKSDGNRWSVQLKQDGVDVTDILLINTEVVVKELTFTYPDIKEHSTAQVFVSHIENPGEFYIQFSTSTNDLDVLADKLKEAGSQGGKLFDVNVGSVCCTQFSEDNCWYRGIVTAVQDDAHVQVHFVDYGNSDVAEKSKVLALNEELVNLNVLAVKCCLDKPGTQWSDEDLSKFEALVIDQELSAEFLTRYDDQWHVKLTCEDTSILDLIREEESAPQAVQENFTVNKKAITQGQTVECGLSHAESPGLFYLQFLSDPSLDKVSDTIASVYPSLAPTERHLDTCQVGSYCCVKFSEDEQWYRAKVTDLCSEDTARVLFIDYGNSEVAAISSFKKLSPELVEIPHCSVPCRLSGRMSKLTPAEVELLEAEMFDKTLNVTFIKPFEEGWDVEIKIDGKHVTEDMLSASAGVKEGGDDCDGGEAKEDTKSSNDHDGVKDETKVETKRSGENDVKDSEPLCDNDESKEQTKQSSDNDDCGVETDVSDGSVNDNKDTKSLSIATLSTNKREGVKFLMVEKDNVVWLQPSATEDELTVLMTNIADQPPSQAMPLADISTGKLCLCRFTEDDEWYRAEVVECAEDQVTVKYVDYGNVETVSAASVSPISTAYTSLPAQAIKCTLDNNPLNEDIIIKLNEEYVEVQLEAEVVGVNDDNVYCVKLFEKDGKELISNVSGTVHSSKEPVPVISQNALDETGKENGYGIDQELDGNKVEETDEAKQSCQTNGNAPHAADGSENDDLNPENMASSNAETPKSLCQGDSKDDSAQMNEVITDIAELACCSQDTSVNSSKEQCHSPAIKTSNHGGSNCGKQLNGLSDDQNESVAGESVTQEDKVLGISHESKVVETSSAKPTFETLGEGDDQNENVTEESVTQEGKVLGTSHESEVVETSSAQPTIQTSDGVGENEVISSKESKQTNEEINNGSLAKEEKPQSLQMMKEVKTEDTSEEKLENINIDMQDKIAALSDDVQEEAAKEKQDFSITKHISGEITVENNNIKTLDDIQDFTEENKDVEGSNGHIDHREEITEGTGLIKDTPAMELQHGDKGKVDIKDVKGTEDPVDHHEGETNGTDAVLVQDTTSKELQHADKDKDEIKDVNNTDGQIDHHEDETKGTDAELVKDTLAMERQHDEKDKNKDVKGTDVPFDHHEGETNGTDAELVKDTTAIEQQHVDKGKDEIKDVKSTDGHIDLHEDETNGTDAVLVQDTPSIEQLHVDKGKDVKVTDGYIDHYEDEPNGTDAVLVQDTPSLKQLHVDKGKDEIKDVKVTAGHIDHHEGEGTDAVLVLDTTPKDLKHADKDESKDVKCSNDHVDHDGVETNGTDAELVQDTTAKDLHVEKDGDMDINTDVNVVDGPFVHHEGKTNGTDTELVQDTIPKDLHVEKDDDSDKNNDVKFTDGPFDLREGTTNGTDAELERDTTPTKELQHADKNESKNVQGTDGDIYLEGESEDKGSRIEEDNTSMKSSNVHNDEYKDTGDEIVKDSAREIQHDVRLDTSKELKNPNGQTDQHNANSKDTGGSVIDDTNPLEELKGASGNTECAVKDSDGVDDGCLSDTALEKLDNILKDDEIEENIAEAKKSCKPM